MLWQGCVLKLFIDGTLQSTCNHVGGIETSAYDLNLGRNADDIGCLCEGLIDDVRIYNYALTEADIKALCYREGV